MSNALDKLVESLGGYDHLNTAELETYKEHLKVMEGKVVTVEDTKLFVRHLISVIEGLLVETRENSSESRNLKARLKNALVLESFLYSQDRARQSLEKYYKEIT